MLQLHKANRKSCCQFRVSSTMLSTTKNSMSPKLFHNTPRRPEGTNFVPASLPRPLSGSNSTPSGPCVGCRPPKIALRLHLNTNQICHQVSLARSPPTCLALHLTDSGHEANNNLLSNVKPSPKGPLKLMLLIESLCRNSASVERMHEYAPCL